MNRIPLRQLAMMENVNRKNVPGRSPTDEKSALLALGRALKSLSQAKGAEVRARCEVDLSARYQPLLHEVKAYAYPIDLPLGNKIHSSVIRLLPKSLKNAKTVITLNPESLVVAAEILAETISRSSLRRKDTQKLEGLIKRCASTLCNLVGEADGGIGWTRVATFLQTAASDANTSFETLASEDSLGSTFAKLKSGLTDSLLGFLRSGDVPRARQLIRAISRHSELETACREVMRTTLDQSASTLPRESQQLAMTTLGITSYSEKIDYANPAERPEMRQAASLLLYLYDLRIRSQELQEAFERYRSLVEQQFKLHLRGSVGAIIPFDPRLHECDSLAMSGTRVKVLRPWVEWYSPPEARTVIRAIVEPETVLEGEQS